MAVTSEEKWGGTLEKNLERLALRAVRALSQTANASLWYVHYMGEKEGGTFGSSTPMDCAKLSTGIVEEVLSHRAAELFLQDVSHNVNWIKELDREELQRVSRVLVPTDEELKTLLNDITEALCVSRAAEA